LNISEQTITIDEFWSLFAGQSFELIGGRVVEMSPSGGLHGAVTRRVAMLLGAYVDEHGLGEVFGAETGFQLTDDMLRGADCAFVSQKKWDSVEEPEKYVPFPPDLAVEVVSSNDRAADIIQKVDLYLSVGTKLVWVIYPDSRKVMVHYPDFSARSFNEDDTLNGEDVVKGLTIHVTNLFPPN
jgi:Uma2 family endonuclease